MQHSRTPSTGIRKALSMLLCMALLLTTVLLNSAGVARAAAAWNAPASSNEGNFLNGIRYGNGLWIAPGAYSHYATSSDGANWTDKTISGATTLNDAFYSGQWVVAGSTGQIFSSPDGTTWTERTSGTGQNLWSLYGNGSTFVAVGDGGAIVTGNGTTFSAQTAGSQSFYGVTYGAGQFVAVGAGGTIYTSADGTAWTHRVSGTGNDLFAAAYANGLYIVGGMSGTMLASTDGVTWTSRTSGVSVDLNGVEHGPGKWVAVGNSGTIISSADGVAWAPETSGVTDGFMHVAQANGLWVAVGAGGLIRTQVALSSNANLSNLAISQGTLNPAFATGTTSYTASVPYTTTSINVTPTLQDATATVRVNGSAANSGSPVTVPLSVGANMISVVVTAQDGGTTKTYTVTVSRAAPSTNANLSNLTLSSGTLTPAFAAGTTAYTATVANSVTSVNVTPTVADSTASVKVNNAATASGNPVTVNLNVGANPISVVVTAQDGFTQKTYTVTVIRPSNNANLSNLTLSSGTLSPAFAAGTTTYTASVPYAVTNVNVTPTVADSTATLTVNGSAATSGLPANVTLSVGANPINVVVTAQDGTTKTYTVTVTRVAASTNANLSGLTLSTGTLSPAFAFGTASYSATVPGGTGSLNVTPTAADSHATLTVNGSAATSGSAVPITVNANSSTTVTVVVTAEDGTTTNTYTVTIWPGPAFTGAATNTSQLVSVGAPLAALQAAGIPGDTLTFSLTGGALPAGIALNADGTFTGAVTAPGSTTATVQAADTHGGTATTSLAVTVQPAPAFTAAATNTSQTVSVTGTPSALQATKATGETLTFSLAGGALPAGVTLNADGTFSGTITALGDTTATIQVTDTHGGLTTTTLVITVQDGPAFTADATNTSQLVSVGAGLTALTATKAAGDTLTFTITGGALPAGNTLAADGTFSGTATTVGSYSATIQAADTHGGHVTTTLTVTVQAAPAFTAAATNTSQLVSVGAGLTALQATKAAGESLTFTLATGALPDGISMGADGSFSGTVTTAGTTSATITVADTHGGQATTALTVTVQAAPAFTAAATNTSQFISASAGLTALEATGAVGETLTFSLTGGSLPAGITLGGGGTFSGTATTPGTTTATITAADTHGGVTTTSLAVTVQAGPAYTAAATNTAQTVSAGAGLTDLQATGAAGETLTFTLAGGSLPAGITLNADGTFSGTTTTVGTTSATIRLTDTHGGKADTTLAVTVQAAPAFTAATANTSQTVSVTGTPAALQVTAAAGETLTFTLTGGSLPAGISLNADGTFSGAISAPGDTTATIRVADTHGGLASTTLTVTVQAGPAFTADIANATQTVSVGAGLTALAATKAAGESLTFTVTGGALPAGITLNAGGTFSGTATTAGSYSATIQAADTHGGKATTTLAVTVQPAPAFTADAANTAQLASVGAPLAALQTTKAAGETLTFTLTGGALPAGISLNGDGTFSGAVTTVGATTATIHVADTHGGQATTALAVTVQAAPAFTGDTTNTSQFISTSAGLAALTATKAAGESLTFTLTGGALPDGINLNSDGTFSGMATTAGDTTATIQAADTHGGKATTALAVTVQQGPAYTADSANTAQTVSVGAGLTALQATAAVGETLTFTLTGGALPAGISLNSDGTFTGTATTTGNTTATIRVADTHGGTATTTLAVTVQAAPAFTGAASNTAQVISTGMELTALQATVATGDTLTFTLTGGALPAGISLNSDGTFTGTATTAGATSATIKAADTHGGQVTTTFAVTVRQGPVFTTAPSNTSQGIFTGGRPAALLATAGADATLTFTLVTGTLPGGVTMGADGTFTGSANATGTFAATVAVTDSLGGRAVTNLTVFVSAPGGGLPAPTFTFAGGVVTTATPTLTGSTNLPDGTAVQVTVDGTTYSGTVSGGAWSATVTTPLSAGVHSVSVSGKNAAGISGLASGSITVQVAPAGTAGGTVTDAVTGQPISGATVTLTQGGQPASTTTDRSGAYSFARVNSLLTYTLKVSHPAYLPETRGPLDLKPGESIDQSFQLAPLGSLRIASPAGGAVLTAPPAAATGTASGTGRVRVELNGVPTGDVAVSAAGTWQADLSGAAGLLVVGANTLRATAYGADNRLIAAASIDFVYAPKGSVAGTVTTDGGAPAPGIALKVLDGSGKQVAATASASDGTYSFGDLPVGSFALQAGTVSTQVSVTAGQTTRQDLVVSAKLNLTVRVAPAAIVGDGKATATVTVTATTGDGKPAAGVTVQIAATAGTLSATSATTGAGGTATVTLTAPLLAGIAARDGAVTATIRDAGGVSAQTAAVVRFVPATIRGRVVSGGAPLAGARVWVAEDFNGDGVTDFAAESITAADGTYALNVPRSNWHYQVHVSATTQMNGRDVTIETVQDGAVGRVTTLGETFSAGRQVSGQLLIAATGGAPAQQPNRALTHGEAVTASLQRIDSGETQPVTISPQGGFAVGNLNPGQYRLTLQVTAPDGRRLAGTAVTLTVTQTGELTVATALIDPYGIVTDTATGKPVPGAQVTLMWADTALNRSKGRTPNTAVDLPILPDFAPNQNADPQITTGDGEYAWMVFPQGDYYILARKDGYRDYDSRQEGRNVAGTDSYVQGGIIHVGESIVSYNFQMDMGAARHTRYIHGYPDGTFGPNQNITRAEVATVLAQLLGPAPGAGAGPQFTDLSGGHWATGSVAIVAARGIMVGDPDGRFRPDDPVSRAEVAVIVSRLRQLAPGSTTFPDVTGHWAAAYIAAAQHAGILSGYPDGTFQPERKTTRAEFVTVINRTLQRGPLVGLMAPTFPDVPLDSWASGMVEEAATDHTYTTEADGRERLVP